MTTHAVVLFAHGSRDPRWREPMEAVARQVAANGSVVECAFLELMAPSLPDACASLVARGASSIRIVPMFLGMGKHVREDLPALVEGLRAAHPAVGFTLAAAIGEEPEVVDLLARIAART